MIKCVFSVLILFVIINNLHSQNQPLLFDWAYHANGTGALYANDITSDESNNIYTTGNFQQVSDFHGDTNVISLTSNGVSDVFVTKHDRYGNLLWAKGFGGGTADSGNSIVTDSLGNVYVAGTFSGTVDFDPGLGILSISSMFSLDPFVCKFDSLGNLIWAKSFEGDYLEYAGGVTVDSDLNLIVCGGFNGSIDFDPGPGTNILTSNNGSDGYACKLNSNGDFIWVAQFLSSNGSYSNKSVKTDEYDNVILGGHFRDTLDSDPAIGVMNLISDGSKDGFVIKLNSFGQYVWAKRIGGASIEEISKIAIGPTNEVVATGMFNGNTDFDPSPSVSAFNSNGSADGFLLKLDEVGDFVWAKQFGGANFDESIGVDIDENGAVYSSGLFTGPIDLDPGIGTLIITPAISSYAMFVSMLDSSGNHLWAEAIEGAPTGGGIIPSSLTIDNLKNLVICGEFWNDVDFDPGIGTHIISNPSLYDAYTVKLNQCYSDSVIIQEACNSFTSPSGKYVWYSTGVYYDTIVNYLGCDSLMTFDLTVIQTNWTDSIVACEMYTWMDSITYYNSIDSVSFTIVNPFGCDTTVTLVLELFQGDSTMQTHSSCTSYTWIDGDTYYADTLTQYIDQNSFGCDSIIYLDLTIDETSDTTIFYTALDSAIINGETYIAPGVYNQTLIAVNGCDSLIEIVLAMQYSSVEELVGDHFLLYPNPTGGTLNFEFDKIKHNILIEISSQEGKIIQELFFEHSAAGNFEISSGSGVYYIRITADNLEPVVRKLVKI
jgi:hypothetical protein